MRRLALVLIALCLSLPALAERKHSFGDLDVHYSAFNSGFLQPEIAAATGLAYLLLSPIPMMAFKFKSFGVYF